MNFQNRVIIKGKVVYWINGQRFENSKDKRDGKEKAVQYCLDNFLNPNDIQKFDSNTECNYYEYLLEQEKKGYISNISHHHIIQVQEEYENCKGDVIPALTYEADFIYHDNATNETCVVDTKGSEYFIDERFLTLKAVFDKVYKEKNMYLKVILYRDKQWIEYRMGDKKKQSKRLKQQSAEIKELRKQIHDREIADNKEKREIDRLKELREKDELSYSQEKRRKELEEKYKI